MISNSKKSPKGFNLNEEHKKFISDHLSQLKFFQDLQQKGRLKQFTQNCIEHLNVETFSFGNILFHKGETTEKIHILVKGDILVYQSKTPKELLAEQIMYKKTKIRNISTQDQLFLKNNMRKLDYISQGVLNVKNVLKLRVGDYFGETTSLDGQKNEQNSIYLANKNIIVLTLYKDILYNLVFIALNEKRRSKFEFFKQLLPSSPLIPLVQFLGYIKEAYFKYKECIYLENEEKSKFLYIISDGEVTIQIQPSEDLKKQYKSKIELAILGKFEVFGDESIKNESRKTDAISRTKQGVSVYYFKAKDLQKQSQLNVHILKLLEKNSRLKTDFQFTQLLHIKQINQQIEIQNNSIPVRKESVIDQLVTEYTKNNKQLDNSNILSSQVTIDQAYDVKLDIDLENTQSSYFQDKYFRSKTVNPYSIRQRYDKTQDTETNSFLQTQASNINERQDMLNISDNFQFQKNKDDLKNINQQKIQDQRNLDQIGMSTKSEYHSPQISRKRLNSDTLSSISVFPPIIKNQQSLKGFQKQLINKMRKKQSKSVFIGYEQNENIFGNRNDEEILNNFSQIEKLKNVKVQNFNKLCLTQRNTDTKEQETNFKTQLEEMRNEYNKNQKSSFEKTITQISLSQCGDRNSQILPQISINQKNKTSDYKLIKNHTKYPFILHQMNIYDKMRMEEQSPNIENEIYQQNYRISNKVIQNRSNNSYTQSLSLQKKSKENQYYHQSNSSNNNSPKNTQTNTFEQKYDKNFSNIRNIHFTKKNLNKMKNFIFSIEKQDTQKQKINSLSQFGEQSYDLNSNDLPLLNLYRIQHKQSVKINTETKPQFNSFKKCAKQVLNNNKYDREQYLPTFHVDYYFM